MSTELPPIVRNPQPESWERLSHRPCLNQASLHVLVAEIIGRVKDLGDEALYQYCWELDGVRLTALACSTEELRSQAQKVPSDLRSAIRLAYANIRQFHQFQAEEIRIVETAPGVTCWRRSLPIERVGLYIPGGSAPLFSTLLMLGVPAVLAECSQIVVTSPPQKDGLLSPALCYVAELLGITSVFKLGGAQAIAAMAYGSESVPKVDKIFGPGNQYVTAAKMLVAQGTCAIDMPAGPSELLIIADESACPEHLASDLLSQAEHGADSQVILAASSEALIEDVRSALLTQLKELSREKIAQEALKHSRFLLFESTGEALEFSNFYAPEHLMLVTKDCERLAQKVRNAGSVFLGPWSAEALGDYASGTNHTLPTAGWARSYSGVSLDSFIKKISFQSVSAEGLKRIGPATELLAEAESLQAHKLAVSRRLANCPDEDIIPKRTAYVERRTKETNVSVWINLDGSGYGQIESGLGFFDHMLEQIVKHGGLDLELLVEGDLFVDEHHTIEDTALTLGQAVRQALGDMRGVQRYGFLLPMDECLAQTALDFGGRPYLNWEAEFSREKIGDMPTEMFEHFFRSFSDAAKCTCHVSAKGENEHHKIEAIFKSFAKTLRIACNKVAGNHEIPSTKGSL